MSRRQTLFERVFVEGTHPGYGFASDPSGKIIWGSGGPTKSTPADREERGIQTRRSMRQFEPTGRPQEQKPAPPVKPPNVRTPGRPLTLGDMANMVKVKNRARKALERFEAAKNQPPLWSRSG